MNGLENTLKVNSEIKPTVAVILPVLNEEKRIRRLVSGIYKYGQGLVTEVLVIVDSGTTDGSRKEAFGAGATVLDTHSSKGVGAAIRCGIEYALGKNFDICAIMAGDSQDDPKDLPTVLNPLISGDFEFVQGSRYLSGQRTINMPLSRSVLTRLYTLGFRLVSGFPVTDASNGFRAFRLKSVKGINLWQSSLDKYALENYLFAQVIKKGCKLKEVPVTKKFDRKCGYSHMIVWRDNSFWAVIRGRMDHVDYR
ncbi:MAG: glycosyltransferase family 2 protein [Candidatus Bathyarchaeota archaeon]|nr:glycosyltransferase family 2 protein [Candidatus Bathyarchaeota archaeon]